MDMTSKTILKDALKQGLIATAATAVPVYIIDTPELDFTLLFSIFVVVTLGSALYSYLFNKQSEK